MNKLACYHELLYGVTLRVSKELPIVDNFSHGSLDTPEISLYAGKPLMDLGLKNKVALVSASSRGLGKAVARSLSREGAKVALCARNPVDLDATAAEIGAETGCEVWARPADVSIPEEAEAWVKAVLEHFGGVHILVNNAGGPPPGLFMDFNREDWEKAFRLNFLSVVSLCKAVLPSMKEQRWGRIINLTSVAVKQPIDGLILSNAVRTGVIGLAKSLSRELAAHGVLVNNVSPGYTLTDRVKKLARDMAHKEGVEEHVIYRRWESSIPAGRLGRPEEIGDFVCFLASERAGYVTGATIQVDGGYVQGTM
jgi:3-oxoacyl-[acyl-carrier protein] reductase